MSGRSQNGSVNVSYTEFLLLAFPGLQKSRYLLAIPFFCLYILIVVGNSMLIYTIRVESSLHSPMYTLIALLFGVNICGTTVVLPMMLLSFVFGALRISLTACLVQMFFLYFVLMVDYNILLMMALDRYVAICHPLRYMDIMTRKLIVILTLVALARSMSVVSPVVILASQVTFCRSNIIRHFVCEHMALMRLSCSDISRNSIVGLLARTITIIFDVSFFLTSYSRIIHAALRITSGHLRNKAFHTCGSHLLVILTVYSSSLISSAVFRLAKSATQDVHNLISAVYLLLPLAVNPVIYGLRTKEIRNNFLKLFKS
ncbi:olfactory receptor 52K1-like [Heteronotia binoei]|uniref:olfactory receptor 52K1-like n=1 Tax=Heteronotia binoei TaxID=13085 RepID=UPI00292F7372|nr:olfactory receptor 52K1-like [Heteronotia binoei]